MCVTICGRFHPDEGAVAGYGNRIRMKYTAKWGVQIAGMIFQTRSSTAPAILAFVKLLSDYATNNFKMQASETWSSLSSHHEVLRNTSGVHPDPLRKIPAYSATYTDRPVFCGVWFPQPLLPACRLPF